MFLTLTYDNEHLPSTHSLVKHHFQDFMKRYRRSYEDKKLRYYHCGEYGEPSEENNYIARPHYHAIIFNHEFEDKILHKVSNGHNLYTSDSLDHIWSKGFAYIGNVTFESAAYCARYILKKVNGKNAEEHYTRSDHTTGEILHLEPEYTTMSRRPGIGHAWLEKYKKDIYRDDFIVGPEGLIINPPKYYDSIHEIDDPESYRETKKIRIEKLSKHKKDLTPERLHTREVCKLAQISQLKRGL